MSLQQVIPRALRAKLDEARTTRAMEGERRVVTMLFSDVKGSTAMAETLDPEEWTQIMNQIFERMITPVLKYEGTVARLMGDAILAFFGAPIAHEDDPQRAVLAGLEIIDNVRPFRDDLKQSRALDFDVRVGINTGLVVVGEVGSDLRVEYTAMGDAVNLAARMEQTAKPGTVQIAENTYKLVRHFFELEALGEIEVKGKHDPVPVYQVLAPKARPAQARGVEGLSSPVIGRERELNLLQANIDVLIAGRGRIVSIIGEAGLGKSRLVAELRRMSPETVAFYEGRCLSYRSSTPFALFVSLFGSIFELSGDDVEKYTSLKAQVSGLTGPRAEKLSPLVATLLGINPLGDDVERVKYLEPPQLRRGLFDAVLEVISLLAAQRPVVLVFEDLHWCDPTSLNLLELAFALVERVPLLMLALFRPQREDLSWKLHESAATAHERRYTSIILEPLSEDNTRMLVASLLHIEDLPEEVRRLILTKSDGNPFFVEEVIRSLLDAKLVVQDEQRWRATQAITSITLPDTLAGVITARLDRLGDEPKRAAQTAAVIGREFGLPTLYAVIDSPAQLETAVEVLLQRELIREKGLKPQPNYAFKHVLTQETAYASLLLSKRRDLHHKVAEYLEQTQPASASEIGWHFLEAQDSTRAAPYLVEAGDRAAQAYSVEEATRFYRQALDIPQTLNDLPLARRAFEGLGRVRFLGNDLPGAMDAYGHMLSIGDTSGHVPMQISALNKLSSVLMYLGEFQELDRNLAQAEALARQYHDAPGLAEGYMVRCQACLSAADFVGALRYLSESVRVGQELSLNELRIFGLSHLSNTMTYIGRFDEAWQTANECRQLAEEAGDKLHLAEVLAFPTSYHYFREGDLDSAQRTAEYALEIASQIGFGIGEFMAEFLLGWITQLRGEHERALSLFRHAVQVGSEVGVPLLEVMGLSALGSAYLDISETFSEEIAEVHLRAMQLLETPAGVAGGGSAWAELGFCTLAFGDFRLAEDFFRKGLTVPTIHALLQKPRHLAGLALVELAHGQLAEALRYAREARSTAEQHAFKHFFPLISLVEGQVDLARGEVESALSHFSRAEMLAVEMGMRPSVWQAQLYASKALSMLDRVAESGQKQQQTLSMVQEIASLFEEETLRVLFLESADRKLKILN